MIVVRVLNNLRAAHLRRGRPGGAGRGSLRLQAVLPGAGPAERRQLAGVLAADGRFVEAAELYDGLVHDRPGPGRRPPGRRGPAPGQPELGARILRP